MNTTDERLRFVEAMRHFISNRTHWALFRAEGGCCYDAMDSAINAFADVACPMLHDEMGPHDDHEKCRVALHAKVFQEGT